MSYEIVKKVVIKKGKTISITRESNNVTPKHFKAYKSDYNYLLDMIYSFVSGNFKVAGKDESICKLENVIVDNAKNNKRFKIPYLNWVWVFYLIIIRNINDFRVFRHVLKKISFQIICPRF